MIAGMRLAIGLLTIIPSGRIGTVTPVMARAAMTTAPLVVLPITGLTGGLGWLAWWLGVPALAAGLMTVAAVAVLNRGMHLDGLADTVDGLGAAWDRERARAVMKRGDVGPMGAVALILVLAMQSVAISSLVTKPWGWLLLMMVLAAARGAASIACTRPLPALSATGLGAQVAGSMPSWLTGLQWFLLAVILGSTWQLVGLSWWQPVVAVLGGGAAVVALVTHCVRRLGGVNGDVMGAAIEVAATVLLLVVSAS